MKKFSSISKVAAAAVLGSVLFTGCGLFDDDDAAPSTPTPTVTMTAADGYIVKIKDTAATVVCDGAEYSSLTNVKTNNGVITFNGLSNITDNCVISVPADVIVDANGNGTYDDAEANNTLGYIMEADGEDEIISQLTTYVRDILKTDPDANVTAIKNLAKTFNPVTAILAASDVSNASENAKAIQLLSLGEMIKGLKKQNLPASAMAKVSYSATISAIDNNSSDANISAMTTSIPAAYTAVATAVQSKAEIIKTFVKNLATLKANNPDLDVTKLIVAISDSKDANISSAVTGAGITGELNTTGAADVNVTSMATALDSAESNITNTGSSLPALLTMGNVLKLGDNTISLNGSTFTTTITKGTDVEDLLKITLPNASVSKAIGEQNVNLSVIVKNTADATDTLEANATAVKLNSSGTDLTITVDVNTLFAVNAEINGTALFAPIYDVSPASELINTDFAFDMASVINLNAYNGQLTTLNTYLEEAKEYNVTIALTGLVDSNVTTDFTTISGTITVE